MNPRYDVEVKDPFQWQCLVGDAVTLADGTLAEYTGACGHPNKYAMQCFVAVTGKVSRPIPMKEGFEWREDEDYVIQEGDYLWLTTSCEWEKADGLVGSTARAAKEFSFLVATPITPAKTEAEAREIPAIGVECDVVCVSSGSITLSPVPDFRRGDRVRVVRVQEEVKKE